MTPRFPTVVASLFLLAACASSVAPEGEAIPFVVAHSDAPNAPEGATSPPTVRVRDGEIEVVGIMTAPNPCYEIDAALSRDGRTLAITLTATGGGEVICVGAIGEYAYRVTVDDLDPGTYRLTVTYRIPGTGWPVTTAVDREVEVP